MFCGPAMMAGLWKDFTGTAGGGGEPTAQRRRRQGTEAPPQGQEGKGSPAPQSTAQALELSRQEVGPCSVAAYLGER